jgi:N-acetylglucosamine kinase-like BadF-type ATPase
MRHGVSTQDDSYAPRHNFVGIDGGGTKTKAVLIDGRGRELAWARGGPSNVHSVGVSAAEAALGQVLETLLSGMSRGHRVTATGVGMAGVARPADRAALDEVLSRLQVRLGSLGEIVVTHDAECALVGGVGRRYGVVLIAGTGAMCYGVNARGATRRADGWGYLLGDEGSAYWIGREALRAATCAHDRRALCARTPATALLGAILAHLDLSHAEALVNRVYAADFGVPQVAALAPLVVATAEAGDARAAEILHDAGRRLGNTLSAVVRGLELAGESFEAVLTGGVLQAQGLVWQEVVSALTQVAPGARAIAPRRDAAYGAAQIAAQLLLCPSSEGEIEGSALRGRDGAEQPHSQE